MTHPVRDEVVPIPPKRIRYFGGPGRMLPSPATVAAVVAQVPERRLLTTVQLRRKLAEAAASFQPICVKL